MKVIAKKRTKIATGTLKPSNLWCCQYWQVMKDVKEIRIVKYLPSNLKIDIYWDPTVEETGNVMAYKAGQVLYICIQGHNFVHANEDSSWMFSKLDYIQRIEGLELLNTSKVKTFKGAFMQCGFDEPSFSIVGMDKWDVSNVNDMSYMFSYAGYQAENWNIGDLSHWNTKSVQNMQGMFRYSGVNAKTWYIGNLRDWDVSNVTDMSDMFLQAGKRATKWFVGNLSSWNTSNVTSMSWMFADAALRAEYFDVGRLDHWDVSNVKTFRNFFRVQREPQWE